MHSQKHFSKVLIPPTKIVNKRTMSVISVFWVHYTIVFLQRSHSQRYPIIPLGTIMWKILSFFLVNKYLILIIPLCFPAVKWSSHCLDKLQLKIISFQNYKHWSLLILFSIWHWHPYAGNEKTFIVLRRANKIYNALSPILIMLALLKKMFIS